MTRQLLLGLWFDPSTLLFYPEETSASPIASETWNAVLQIAKASDRAWQVLIASPYSWPTNETLASLIGWLTNNFPTIEFNVIDTTPNMDLLQGGDTLIMPGSASVGRTDVRRIDDVSCTGKGITAPNNVTLQNLWRSLLNAGEETTKRNLTSQFTADGIL